MAESLVQIYILRTEAIMWRKHLICLFYGMFG